MVRLRPIIAIYGNRYSQSRTASDVEDEIAYLDGASARLRHVTLPETISSKAAITSRTITSIALDAANLWLACSHGGHSRKADAIECSAQEAELQFSKCRPQPEDHRVLAEPTVWRPQNRPSKTAVDRRFDRTSVFGVRPAGKQIIR